MSTNSNLEAPLEIATHVTSEEMRPIGPASAPAPEIIPSAEPKIPPSPTSIHATVVAGMSSITTSAPTTESETIIMKGLLLFSGPIIRWGAHHWRWRHIVWVETHRGWRTTHLMWIWIV